MRPFSIARELAIGSVTGAAIGLAVVFLMLLSGCIDKEKRQADFMGRCEAAKIPARAVRFSPGDCRKDQLKCGA
jgi:hypothetical protein